MGTQAPEEVKNNPDILSQLTRNLQRAGLNVSMPSGTTPPTEEGQPVGVGGRSDRPEGEDEGAGQAPNQPKELEPIPSMGKDYALPPWQVGRRKSIYEFDDGSIIQADVPEKNFKQFANQFDFATGVWEIEKNVENFVKFLNAYKINAKVLTEKEKDEYLLSTGEYTKTEDDKLSKNLVHERDKETNIVELKKELRKLLRPNMSKQEVEDKIIDLGLKMKALPEGKEKADLQRQIDNQLSQMGMFEWYEASRKNNFQKRGGNMNKIVKEGSVGTRGIGSFMENFVEIAKGIVTAKSVEKTASVEVKAYPEQMTIAEAEANGFLKSAKSCGWGAFATEPLDGGAGGIWFTEKGDDGKDYLVKQVSQEGEVIRRFKEKQASLKKQSAVGGPATPERRDELERERKAKEEARKKAEEEANKARDRNASLNKKAEAPKCPKCGSEMEDVGNYKWDCPQGCFPTALELGQIEDMGKELIASETGADVDLERIADEAIRWLRGQEGMGSLSHALNKAFIDHHLSKEQIDKLEEMVASKLPQRTASEENKDRGVFTVYTKKPADLKGKPALGDREAKEKKNKGIFDVYKSKPVEKAVEKEADKRK